MIFYYSRRDTEAIESYKKQKETEMDSGAFEKRNLVRFLIHIRKQ